MVLGWRHNPIGAGLTLLRDRAQRQLAGYGQGILKLSEEEFEEALRAGNASEVMIEKELREFRQLKAATEAPVKTVADRRRERRERAVQDPDMQRYVDAEIRRVSGIAADEVLESIEEERRR